MDSTKLQNQVHNYVPRFATNPGLFKKMMQQSPESVPLVPPPQAPWTKAIKSKSGELMPQVIAHRGYRSRYPENTMLSFRGAISSGAHALETDVHLTKDNVVVLSHDPTLRRCFGKEQAIADCDWSYISSLRTTQSPNEPMPRLVDLLEYMAKPGMEDIWLLLDIKMDDEPDLMMRCISEAIASMPASSKKSWDKRIVLGIWAIKYLEPCAKYLPTYAISNIGFSTLYARLFLTPKTPNVTFNLFYSVIMMPFSGPRFIVDAHAQNRAVYAWTVNDEAVMRWCMQHSVDGIITDDVKKLVDVREAWERGDRKPGVRLRSWIFIVWVWCITVLIGIFLRRRMEGGWKKRSGIRA